MKCNMDHPTGNSAERPPFVRLRKTGPCHNPKAETPDWNDYPFGTGPAGISLPAGYELSGYLLQKPKVGARLILLRVSRNGVFIPGLFFSSEITGINGSRIQTMNSIYSLEDLPE
jgi:hypothetical protein